MNNQNVSILVSSCDKYQEAWMPFFTLLSKYWKECEYPKYLITETSDYSDFGVKTLKCRDAYWSNRLLYALSQIESEYILFFLEDFFIMEEVDSETLNRFISYMERNKEMSVIYLKKSTGQETLSRKFPELIKMEKGKQYYINFQAALWRRQDMINVIKPNSSPWEIEENSDWDVPGDFYCVRQSSYSSTSNDVIPYLWALEAGYGICKSKWLWNNIRFFNKEGIPCKCETLPRYRKSSYLCKKLMNCLFRYNMYKI